MPTEKKLIFAIIVLAALGGAVVLQRQKQSADTAAHSVEGLSAPFTMNDDRSQLVERGTASGQRDPQGRCHGTRHGGLLQGWIISCTDAGQLCPPHAIREGGTQCRKRS